MEIKTKDFEIEKGFLEEGWEKEIVGKNATIFTKPISKETLESMPELETRKPLFLDFLLRAIFPSR